MFMEEGTVALTHFFFPFISLMHTTRRIWKYLTNTFKAFSDSPSRIAHFLAIQI